MLRVEYFTALAVPGPFIVEWSDDWWPSLGHLSWNGRMIDGRPLAIYRGMVGWLMAVPWPFIVEWSVDWWPSLGHLSWNGRMVDGRPFAIYRWMVGWQMAVPGPFIVEWSDDWWPSLGHLSLNGRLIDGRPWAIYRWMVGWLMTVPGPFIVESSDDWYIGRDYKGRGLVLIEALPNGTDGKLRRPKDGQCPSPDSNRAPSEFDATSLPLGTPLQCYWHWQSNTIPVAGREGPYGCWTSRLPHRLDSRLTVGGVCLEIVGASTSHNPMGFHGLLQG
jgi:hypothetical protein